MDVKKRSKQSGQAFFEFIIFTPFLISLMLLLIKISAAINGSINQQKVTRGYYYYLVRNNSNIPDYAMLTELRNRGLTNIGFYSVGWRERREGDSPVAPCYNLDPFIGGEVEGSCEEALRGDTRTSFIKPVTAYGICSTSYSVSDDEFIFNPLNRSGAIGSSCSLQ